jgi:hypothetical protein
LLKKVSIPNPSGQNTYQVDVSGLPNGIFYFEMVTSKTTYSQKFVIQHKK